MSPVPHRVGSRLCSCTETSAALLFAKTTSAPLISQLLSSSMFPAVPSQIRQTPPPLLTLAARAIVAQSLNAAAVANSLVAVCGGLCGDAQSPVGCGCGPCGGSQRSTSNASSSASNSSSAGGGGGHSHAFGAGFGCRRRKRDALEGTTRSVVVPCRVAMRI